MSWTETPTLVGRHVSLRPLVPEDRDALLAAVSEDRAWEMFFTMAPGPETIDAYLATAFREQSYGRVLPFAVCRPDGKLIGTTRYMRMAKAHRRLEIGATVYAASARRSGVNTEAKLLLLTHAFEKMACVAVEIRTDWLNKRSQAAIVRLGAKLDGVLRNHLIAPDGRVRDMVVYSILANEWSGVRRNLEYLLARNEGRP